MTNPPRRKRFQFHLSTAIVLMLVAAGLMWANMQPHFLRPVLWSPNGVEEYATRSERDFRSPQRDACYLYYGWPRFVIYSVHLPNTDKESEFRLNDVNDIIVTILVAAGGLIGTVVTGEHLLPRRAAQK